MPLSNATERTARSMHILLHAIKGIKQYSPLLVKFNAVHFTVPLKLVHVLPHTVFFRLALVGCPGVVLGPLFNLNRPGSSFFAVAIFDLLIEAVQRQCVRIRNLALRGFALRDHLYRLQVLLFQIFVAHCLDRPACREDCYRQWHC